MPNNPFDKFLDLLVEGIYNGEITDVDLPEGLYLAIADYLKRGLYKGFEYTIDDVPPEDLSLLTELRENIYMFSGAKTYQQVREMTDHLTDSEGNVRSFAQFKELVKGTFELYNDTWLRTEYETAIGQAQSAAKWSKIERDKDVLPLLQYNAVGDENTCDICGPLNGIIAPVGDPIWGKIAPINHYNCRCLLEQLDKGKVTGDRGPIVDGVLEKMNPIWQFNPGKEGVVFSEKHPYFSVPKGVVKLAQENFNLPIPETDR